MPTLDGFLYRPCLAQRGTGYQLLALDILINSGHTWVEILYKVKVGALAFLHLCLSLISQDGAARE